MAITMYGSFTYYGNESISSFGTDGRDRQIAGRGNDFLRGYGGNDFLDGSYGDDYLEGGEGHDFLFGGEDQDRLIGGNGDDVLKGFTGNDLMLGGEGVDLLDGGDGNDVLNGYTGNDGLFGGLGNDILNGDIGDDYLNGYGSVITNDSQFDHLIGRSGSDTFVLGNPGAVFYNETGDGYAVIQDWDPFAGSPTALDLEFDSIQLAGKIGQYKTEVTSVGGIGTAAQDTKILFSTGDGWELIGIIQDSTNFNFNRDVTFV